MTYHYYMLFLSNMDCSNHTILKTHFFRCFFAIWLILPNRLMYLFRRDTRGIRSFILLLLMLFFCLRWRRFRRISSFTNRMCVMLKERDKQGWYVNWQVQWELSYKVHRHIYHFFDWLDAMSSSVALFLILENCPKILRKLAPLSSPTIKLQLWEFNHLPPSNWMGCP